MLRYAEVLLMYAEAKFLVDNDAFFDLVRWGDAPTALANKGKKLYKFFGYKPGTTEWDVVVEEGKGKGWQDKYEFLPFPFEQISANPNLKQNPGW